VGEIARPLTPDQAQLRLEAFSRWSVHSPLPVDVSDAVRLSQRHLLSFWDSMIILSTKKMNCQILWTEDLNPGQSIEGVQVRNPFVSA